MISLAIKFNSLFNVSTTLLRVMIYNIYDIL